MIRNDITVAKDLTTSSTTTEEINKIGFTFGHVYIPVGSTITTLTFHGAPSVETGADFVSGTYTACYEDDGTGTGTFAAVVITVAAGKNYPLPASVADIPFLKVVANAAETIRFTFSS